MVKQTFSGLPNSFFTRNWRGRAALWGLLLMAVVCASYALRLWKTRLEEQRSSFLSGSPQHGGSLFSNLGCSTCHAIYGIGPRIGPDLGTSFPAGSSPVRIVAEMWSHGPQMWQKIREAQLSLPHITEQDAADLLAFLYIVRYQDAPGDVDNGRRLFASKSCAQCHSLDGSNKLPGPDLKQVNVETPIIWAQQMWNHGESMQTKMAQSNVPWPTFEGQEMVDLLAYLQNEAPGERREAGLLPASPSKGKIIFREKGCSSCHSVNGGGGHEGPDLGPQHAESPSIVQFSMLMWNHSPQMWTVMQKKGIPRPKFAEREMADLIAYLYLTRYMEPVGLVERGAQVFNEKHCSTCHGANGHGGKEGPNLARRGPYYAVQLAYTVWSHGPQMYRHMREQNILWPSLNETEMGDLLAFMNSL
jgi:mono/diheme cytochrome c family protein